MNWKQTLGPGVSIIVRQDLASSNSYVNGTSWTSYLATPYDGPPVELGDMIRDILNSRMTITDQSTGRTLYTGTMLDLALTRLDQGKPAGMDFEAIAKTFGEIAQKIMNPIRVYDMPANYPSPLKRFGEYGGAPYLYKTPQECFEKGTGFVPCTDSVAICQKCGGHKMNHPTGTVPYQGQCTCGSVDGTGHLKNCRLYTQILKKCKNCDRDVVQKGFDTCSVGRFDLCDNITGKTLSGELEDVKNAFASKGPHKYAKRLNSVSKLCAYCDELPEHVSHAETK